MPASCAGQYNPDQFPGLHYKLLDARPITSQLAPATSTGAQYSLVKSESASPAVSTAAGVAPAASSSSSLTLTLYFSGRFTLVGAQHELDVYKHFERVSRTLFPFSHVQSQQQLTYEVWLEESSREERTKGGRMGWEDEADRVRVEMDKRERKRRAHIQRLHSTVAASGTQSGQQPAGVGGEVRVKTEPGTGWARKGGVDDERKEAGGMRVVPVHVEQASACGQIDEAKAVLVGAVGGQQGVAECAEVDRSSVGGGSEVGGTSTAAVSVVSHVVEQDRSVMDEDVDWE